MQKKILLTGASGYIGSKLYVDLKKEFDVTGTCYTNKLFPELVRVDVTNKAEVAKIVDEIKPELIIHVANNPSSKWVDENPTEALKINQYSTEYLVYAANKCGAKIIFISSMGAINPFNQYQKIKLISENMVKETMAGYLNVRLSVAFGLSPNTTQQNLFNQFLIAIKNKAQVEADIALKFQPTYIKHVSEVIKKCILNNIWNKYIPISVDEMKSKYEIFSDIAQNFDIKITPIDSHRPPFNKVENVDQELVSLGLPTIKYKEMIDNTVADIKELLN